MKETCKGYYTVEDRKHDCHAELGCGKAHCPVNRPLGAVGMGMLLEDVTAFKKAHDQPLPEGLYTPSEKRVNLLYDLILEEFVEVTNAIYQEDGTQKVNHAELAKELADVVYVTVGMAIEFGIPLDKVWDEVQRSNMSKIGPDGKFVTRADGKILKGPDYKAPDIEGCLK